jgi:hypothetical protein
MMLIAQALVAAAFLEAPAKPTHFDVTAAYEPRRAGAAEVAVRFVARDPDVKINEHPAPKLKIDRGPLAVVPPAPKSGETRPAPGEPGHYLDLTLPVTFPVTVAPGTSRGEHAAGGTVTYFYCSKREGWCRKGAAPVSLTVTVR